MINSIVPVQSASNLNPGSATVASAADVGQRGQTADASVQDRATTDPAATSKPVVASETKPDVRLTIEENGDHTGYVYKMVDRFTGKTIAEIPREAVSQIGASDSYSAGSVVSTSA